MAEVLELAHLGEYHHMAQVQVRRRGIESALDPQRPLFAQPFQQFLLPHQIHDTAAQFLHLMFRRTHGARIYEFGFSGTDAARACNPAACNRD